MNYDPAQHRRRSIRLKGHDYAQPGMYFITICTESRSPLFGEVRDGEMRLNKTGQTVEAAWGELPVHYAGLEIDAFIVMPNHVHGIVILHGAVDKFTLVGAGFKPAPTNSAHNAAPAGSGRADAKRHGVPEIVRAFKTFSARRVNLLRRTSGPIWQRGYYDHIIRRGDSLDRIRRYIAENPARWAFDRENPQAVRPEPEEPWARH